MDLDLEINKILNDRGIGDAQDLFVEDMLEYVNSIIESYAQESRVGFAGCQEEIEFVISHFNEANRRAVYQCNTVSSGEYDKFVITSYEDISEQDKNFLERMDAKPFVLYQELRRHGYLMVYGDKGLVKTQRIQGYIPNLYERIALEKKAYEQEDEKGKRQARLQKLILSYLQIRDFLHVKEYITRFIEEGFDCQGIYENIWRDIEDLLRWVKDTIRERKCKDVIILWNDALGYNNFEETTYIKEFAKDSLFFGRAYTTTPFTSAALKVMFDQKLQIEDHAYNEANFNCGESKLSSYVLSKGYDIRYWGLKGIAGRLCPDWSEDGNGDFGPSTIRYWRLLNHLINSPRPVFGIVHSFVETHMPWLSSELEAMNWFAAFEDSEVKEEESQRSASLRYWDEQFGFYTEFLDYPCNIIFMSDHGSVKDLRECRFSEKNLHISFYIKGNGVIPKRCDRLFGLYHFLDVIQYIFEPSKDNFEKLFEEGNLVYFEDADVYNPSFVKAYLDKQIRQHGMAFRGAVGENDKYVLIGDGEEMYYILPDEENNRVGDPAYKDRIEELRTKAGHEFLDIENNSKFLYSKQLYDNR